MLGDLKWMKEIEAGMQNVPDKYRTPDLGEVAPNEEVIGTVPDALLPMLYFSEQLHDEFQQATEAIEKTHAEGGDCSPLHDAAPAKEVPYQNLKPQPMPPSCRSRNMPLTYSGSSAFSFFPAAFWLLQSCGCT